MKRMKILFVIIMMLLASANSQLNAQHGMRGMMRDSVRTSNADSAWMKMHWGPLHDMSRMHGMRPMWGDHGWRAPFWSGPGGRWEDPFWYEPRKGDFYRMRPAHFHRGADSTFTNHMDRYTMSREGYALQNIPGLTENQKAKLKDQMAKNKAEMKKFREETAASMKSMREKHRNKIYEILTPEQKKWMESRIPDHPEN